MSIFHSRILLPLSAAVCLASPSAFATSPGHGSAAPRAERLLGLAVGPEGVTFQVASGGCTTKESFRFLVQETQPPQITLVRDNPDYCEAYLPYGVALTFSFAELGVAPGSEFEIENALLGRYRNDEAVSGGAACQTTGCSGQICAEESVISTCEWREEYACYAGAECTRQADGACGWTQTPELTSCIAAARPQP